MGYGVVTYGAGGYGLMARSATATFVAHEIGPLDIVVTDPNGNGIEGFAVSIESADGEVTRSGQTDSDGSAVFQDVKATDYTVTGSKDGWTDVTGEVPEGKFT